MGVASSHDLRGRMPLPHVRRCSSMATENFAIPGKTCREPIAGGAVLNEFLAQLPRALNRGRPAGSPCWRWSASAQAQIPARGIRAPEAGTLSAICRLKRNGTRHAIRCRGRRKTMLPVNIGFEPATSLNAPCPASKGGGTMSAATRPGSFHTMLRDAAAARDEAPAKSAPAHRETSRKWLFRLFM